jgi:signal transduction histidine kinase
MLTNVARHAQATVIRIQLAASHGSLILEVCDNGVGISEAALFSKDSLGLLGMRERASQCGGTIVVERPLEGGTMARLQLPLESEADDANTDRG